MTQYSVMSLIFIRMAMGRLVLTHFFATFGVFFFVYQFLRLICFGDIQSRIAGRVFESIESIYSISRQRTLDKGMDCKALIFHYS
jgi:hypothetical protein